MTNFVQKYASTDTGAPVLTGQVNKLCLLLNAVLVDGYATASVTSITFVGTLATFTLGSANTTLVTGNVIKFAGCTGGDASLYNITTPVTMSSSTVGTYTMAGTPSGNATGTLTYNKAGLAWTKPFAGGTNSQTYRSADAGSNQFYLQVVDNGATAGGALESQVYGAEVMSADQAVTSGQFPTAVQAASGRCVRKSATADGTARAWVLYGDDRTFYLFISNGDSIAYSGGCAFGHFITHKSGDAFNTFLAGTILFNTAAVSAQAPWQLAAVATTSNVGISAARLYSQAGAAVPIGLFPATGAQTNPGTGGAVTYPNPADSGAYVTPVLIADTAGNVRGRMPGLYTTLHNGAFSQGDTITGVVGLSGVTLTAQVCESAINTAGQWALDTFGAWT